MYHAGFLHHGTDGRDAGLMVVVGIGDRSHDDGSAFLEPSKFVLKDIEADLQVLGIHNAEERLTWGSGGIEDGIELRHDTRDGGLDGAVVQLVLQLSESCFGRVIAAVDACQFPDGFWNLVEISAFIALSHQDVLILIFCPFQFRPAFGDFVLNGSPVEAYYDLTFVYALSHFHT